MRRFVKLAAQLQRRWQQARYYFTSWINPSKHPSQHGPPVQNSGSRGISRIDGKHLRDMANPQPIRNGTKQQIVDLG